MTDIDSSGIKNVKEQLVNKDEQEFWQEKFTLLNKRIKNKSFFLVASVISSIISVGIIFLIFFFVDWMNRYEHKYKSLFDSQNIILAISISIFLGLVVFLALYSLTVSRRDRSEYELTRLRAEEIKKDIKIDFFDNLIELSNNYLDKYYNQTKVQAEKSFYVSLFISVFGAIIICLGIVFLFLDKVNPAYLSTAAGVLSEFIAAVFFYFYNSTIKSMSKYHTKLVLSQNISIALKVAETLPPQLQGELRAELIKQLVNDINRHIITEVT